MKLSGGGAVAILRDTSWSMNGTCQRNPLRASCANGMDLFVKTPPTTALSSLFPLFLAIVFTLTGLWSSWAASLCLRVVEVAKRHRMRIGYVEFNHEIDPHFAANGSFLSKEYQSVSDRVTSLDCQGITNYQLPLQTALDAFEEGQAFSQGTDKSRGNNNDDGKSGYTSLRGGGKRKVGAKGRQRQRQRRGANDKHILFVTDGLPTTGAFTNSISLLSLSLSLCLFSRVCPALSSPLLLHLSSLFSFHSFLSFSFFCFSLSFYALQSKHKLFRG